MVQTWTRGVAAVLLLSCGRWNKAKTKDSWSIWSKMVCVNWNTACFLSEDMRVYSIKPCIWPYKAYILQYVYIFWKNILRCKNGYHQQFWAFRTSMCRLFWEFDRDSLLPWSGECIKIDWEVSITLHLVLQWVHHKEKSITSHNTVSSEQQLFFCTSEGCWYWGS